MREVIGLLLLGAALWFIADPQGMAIHINSFVRTVTGNPVGLGW